MSLITVGDFYVTDRMRERVLQVLDSGRISYGPLSKELEQKFASLHECRYGVLSNSGTSSLQVALQALKEMHGWEDGDYVLVPAVTFPATVNIVLHNKMRPVLVDVEPNFYGIDVEKFQERLHPPPALPVRAVIPVHLFGQPCDMAGVNEVVINNDNGIKILEDSCECMFAQHWGMPVGSWSHVGCFSTYVAHILTTGVGGIATTNNPDLAVLMRSLVNHGRDGIYISIDDDDGLDGGQLQEVVSRRFNFTSIGHSFRITELEAALALAQLEEWETNIARRQTNAATLSTALSHLKDRLQLPSLRPQTTHSYMMYPIVLRDGDKWGLCNFLEERGIETREMLRLTDQPCYRGLWDPADYPVADFINKQGFYVGCHPGLTKSDMERVASTIEDWLE